MSTKQCHLPLTDMANHTLTTPEPFIILLHNILHILAPLHLLVTTNKTDTMGTIAVVEEASGMETLAGVEDIMETTDLVTISRDTTIPITTSPKLQHWERRRSVR